MTAIFTIFLTQFVSPIPIVVGIAAAFISRAWWHVIVTAFVAALIGEYLSRISSSDHIFSAQIFAMGVFASGLWAAWFFWIRQTRLKGE